MDGFVERHSDVETLIDLWKLEWISEGSPAQGAAIRPCL